MSTICHKKVLFGTNVYQKNGQNPSIGSLTHPKKLGLSKRVEKTIHATGSVHWMSATNRPRKIGQNFWWQFKRTRDFGASWYLYYFRDILIHRGKKKKNNNLNNLQKLPNLQTLSESIHQLSVGFCLPGAAVWGSLTGPKHPEHSSDEVAPRAHKSGRQNWFLTEKSKIRDSQGF